VNYDKTSYNHSMQKLSSPPSSSRFHEIDGLRGIAVLFVLITHWIVPSVNSTPGMANMLNIFAYGVDLFFIISGFLIGGILLNAERKISNIFIFYLKRILRIWPSYYLLLGLVYFLWGGQRVFVDIPYWSYFLFIFNFWESLEVNFNVIFSILWSLAIEEQFYAIAPLLFFFLGRRQLIHLTILYIIIAPFLRLSLISSTSMILWRFTPVRLDGISMGVFLSIILADPNVISFLSNRIAILKTATSILFIATIILKAILPFPLWFSFGTSLMNLSFAFLLTTVMMECWLKRENLFLTSAVLRYLGIRCYSIYLFHIFFREIAIAVGGNLLVILSMECILTIGFAHLSWRYIELPLIKLSRRLSY
jgi:peptidoglycan/LPS O-acetylase OafA/YrhL